MINNGLMVRLSECAVEQLCKSRNKCNFIILLMQKGQGKRKSEDKEKQAIISQKEAQQAVLEHVLRFSLPAEVSPSPAVASPVPPQASSPGWVGLAALWCVQGTQAEPSTAAHSGAGAGALPELSTRRSHTTGCKIRPEPLCYVTLLPLTGL